MMWLDDKKLGMICVTLIVMGVIILNAFGKPINQNTAGVIQSVLTGIFGAAIGISYQKVRKPDEIEDE
ncbi:MAG: hypothetical protein ACYSOO_07765 [Planctomycetota bacterium]|jgi:uncharacterized membrane protein required for colicin V production